MKSRTIATTIPATGVGLIQRRLSSRYVNGQPFGVFMVAKAPQNGVFNQAAYTTKEPLLVAASEQRFSSKSEKQISRATVRFESSTTLKLDPLLHRRALRNRELNLDSRTGRRHFTRRLLCLRRHARFF
jgi:hypothetical protein